MFYFGLDQSVDNLCIRWPEESCRLFAVTVPGTEDTCCHDELNECSSQTKRTVEVSLKATTQSLTQTAYIKATTSIDFGGSNFGLKNLK